MAEAIIEGKAELAEKEGATVADAPSVDAEFAEAMMATENEKKEVVAEAVAEGEKEAKEEVKEETKA